MPISRSRYRLETLARIWHRPPPGAAHSRYQPDARFFVVVANGPWQHRRLRRSEPGRARQAGGGLRCTESCAGVAQLAEQPSCKRAREPPVAWGVTWTGARFGTHSARYCASRFAYARPIACGAERSGSLQGPRAGRPHPNGMWSTPPGSRGAIRASRRPTASSKARISDADAGGLEGPEGTGLRPSTVDMRAKA